MEKLLKNFPPRRSSVERRSASFSPGHFRAFPPYFYFLVWLILLNIIVFFMTIIVLNGTFEKVLVADKSYISLLIIALFFTASVYCAYHLFFTARSLLRAEQILGLSDPHSLPDLESYAPNKSHRQNLVDGFLVEMNAITNSEQKGPSGSLDQSQYVFEIYVDMLRAPGELIGFMIDVLIRLGLIGTIIGFILMLESFVTGPNPSAENIQELLITMSGGMGTALYTTFAGLVASTLLGVQQLLLNRNVESLIAALIRASDQLSPPVNDEV